MTISTIRHNGAKRSRGRTYSSNSDSSNNNRPQRSGSHTSKHRSNRRSASSDSTPSSPPRLRTYSSSFRSGGSRGRSSGGRGRGNAGGNAKRGGRKMGSFDPSQFINKNPVESNIEVYQAKNTFATFGLDKRLVENITKMGIAIPSPIQDQIIPEIMNGRDVIGLAETGTGKTAAFLIPVINKTILDSKQTTIILAPTRELAIQIQEELRKLVTGFHIYSTTCVGGMHIGPQIMSLKRSNHFIIGTPGRILDLIKREKLPTENIKTVILDEADRMLDMGFIHDMRAILSTITKDRSTLFFSATTSPETDKIVNDFMKNPLTVSVKKKDVIDSIEQDVIAYSHNAKFGRLLELVKQPGFSRVLIFGAMKHSVEKLAQELAQQNIEATSIHGNKSHGQRQKALKLFKDGKVNVLVATDVAARGIHVDDVTHVINYDLPSTFEDYVHRIGRTGRGSKKGKAFTFIADTPAVRNYKR